MNDLKKVQDVYHKLNFMLSAKQKRYAILVLVMALIAAALELLGVAVIIPILDMMLDMDSVRNKWFIKPFIGFFHLNTDGQIVWLICLAVIGIYLLKNFYFAFYNWVSFKYAYKVRRELSTRILGAYMRQGYIFFVEHNTSRLLQGIEGDIDSVYSIINSIFSMIMKAMTIICIGVFILLKSKQMALLLCCLAVFCFVFIQVFYRKAMQRNGILRRNWLFEKGKISIEAIQGNKEILVMNKQNFFISLYEKILTELYRVCVKVDLGSVFPSYIIEMICIGGIMFAVAVQMNRVEDSYSLLSQLSTIAVGAFRILPALGAITSSINIITMNTSQLAAAYETLSGVKELEKNEIEQRKKIDKYRGIGFQHELKLCGIDYRYPKTDTYVIRDANLTIKKGQSIAFVGPSGAGKTTLSDIILSLLKPEKGKILMDGIDIEDLGQEWNRIIGYVPQSVYIVDDTIKSNIAFGEDLSAINEEDVWAALKIAQLDKFVKDLPEGLNTVVGERGVRFSGGQRQRLAIARALYRNPEIMVLDEATAALDNETENEVMKAIEALQGYKTMIIVAHRLTTVRNCDEIYEVKEGKVLKKAKEEVLESSR